MNNQLLSKNKFQLLIVLNFLALCISIVGCKKKSSWSTHERWQQKQLEARLYDVPILVDAQLMQNVNNSISVDECTIMSYETSFDYEQACSYYQEEMERLGWWQTVAFKGTEALFNFEKPNKYCSVSIRPLKKIARVLIFTGQKI